MDVADSLACDAALDGQEEMADEEIQETVTNQKEEEEEEEIPHQHTGPSAQEAIPDMDNIITWLSQEADADPLNHLNIKTVRRFALSKVTITSHVHSSSPQTVSTSNSPPP